MCLKVTIDIILQIHYGSLLFSLAVLKEKLYSSRLDSSLGNHN